jgi:hypothetical protein
MSFERRQRVCGGDGRILCRSRCRVQGCLEPRAIVVWSSGVGNTGTASPEPLVSGLQVAENSYGLTPGPFMRSATQRFKDS